MLTDASMEIVDDALRRWQADLLDLTRANKLLHIGARSSAVLRLQHPDSSSLLKFLRSSKRRLTFYQPASFTAPLSLSDDEPPITWTSPRAPGREELITDLDPIRLQNVLNGLRLRSNTLIREQGVQTLFVVFGTARWKATSRDEEYISPLLLVPVRLERSRALDPHTLTGAGQDPVVNPALLQRLAMITGAEIPDFDASFETDWNLDLIARQLTNLGRSLASWRIETESAMLGMFSFAKYAMYADLERNHERLRNHQLVKAVAGAGGESLVQPAALPNATELDTTSSSRASWQILDADSSQQETIAWVGAGASLVVQGPPGTGKSQTIANIIAEALGRGRTVLFVSEKLAALRIVSNRLESCGLRPFLLEAHGSNEDRREIYRGVYQTWQEQRCPSPVRLASLDLLDGARSRLAAYARALHNVDTPLGISAYQAVAEVTKLAGSASLRFVIEQPALLTESRREVIRDAVRHLVLIEHVVREQDRHPWRGCRLFEEPGADGISGRQLIDELTTIADRARDLITVAPGIATIYEADIDLTVAGLQRLAELIGLIARSSSLPAGWQDNSHRQSLRQLRIAGQELLSEYHVKRERLLGQVDSRLLDAKPEELLRAVRSAPQASQQLISHRSPAVVAVDCSRPEVQPLIAEFRAALALLRVQVAEMAERFGIAPPQTPVQVYELTELARSLVANLRAPASWLDSTHHAKTDGLLSEAERRSDDIRRGSDRLLTFFPELHLPLLTEADVRQPLIKANPSLLRQLMPSYRRALKRMRNAARPPNRITPQLATDLVAEANGLQQNHMWFQANHASLAELAGCVYQGETTNWKLVRSNFTQVQWILGRVPSPLPHALIPLLCEQVPGELSTAVSALERARDRVDALASQLISRTVLITQPGSSWQSISLAAVEERAADIHAQLSEVWNAIEAVRIASVAGPIAAEQIEQVLQDAVTVAELRTRWISVAETLGLRFGSLVDPEKPDWAAIDRELDLAEQIACWYGGFPPASLVDNFDRLKEAAPADFTALSYPISEILARDKGIVERFDRGALPAPGRSLTETDLAQVVEWADSLAAQSHRLKEWYTFLRAEQLTEEAGISGVIADLQCASLPAADWSAAVERRVLEAWLEWWRSQNALLTETEISLLPDRVSDFRQLDKAQWKLARDRIRERVVNRFPDRAMVKMHRGKRTAGGLLAHEASKRQRHIPLRRFFAEHAQFLASITPCWLMSPLAVAQHLGESDFEFDLVVFDEASQILPADAIGAIGRGKQVVVVGDPEQLPPTRFFAAGTAMLDGDGEEEVPESILDACREVLPMRTLNWHYRSRYEQLIAFSNAHFYDSRLLSLPSTDAGKHPISLIHVPEGIYDAGKSRTNRAEARHVADAVIAYRKQHPLRSLGVVTFSEAQMIAVQYEIDVRKRADASLERLLSESSTEGFFVKNLENVQGDERDTIFFSVGYGPDKQGRFSHNFGPLNRAGGERRLNVAITRAREEVVIFASFTSEQIDERRTSARGLQLLKEYLGYAEQGERALKLADNGSRFDPLVARVAATLEEQGLMVRTVYGTSVAPIDIVVKDPQGEHYVLAIETDGITYNGLPTVRDRERLRAETLERMGWRVYQMRSLRWLDNQSGVIQDILSLASQAIA